MAAGKREYIAMFSIGAKLLGSFRGAMGQAQSRLRRLAATARSVTHGIGIMAAALGGLAIGAGIAAAGLLLRKIFTGAEDAYKEQLLINTQLQAVLQANANIQALGPDTAREQMELLGKQAGELQKVGVVTDEVLLAGAKQLAIFGESPKKISEMMPIFGDVLAAQKGVNAQAGDANKLALQVGKAIKDGQLLGLKKLGLEMGKLDPKQFKALSREERRVKVLEAMRKKYEGVSAAIGATDIGKLTIAGHLFGELQEQVGKITMGYKIKWAEFLIELLPKLEPVIDRIGTALGKLFGGTEEAAKLYPVRAWGGMWVAQEKKVSGFAKAVDGVVKAIEKLATWIEWVADNKDWLGPLAKNVAILTGVLYGLSVAIGVVSAVMAVTPVGWLIIGIMALVVALAYLILNWDKVKAAVDKTWAALGNIPVIGPILQASLLPLKLIMAAVQGLIDTDWSVWAYAWEGLKTYWTDFVTWITTPIDFSAIWETLKTSFSSALDYLKGLWNSWAASLHLPSFMKFGGVSGDAAAAASAGQAAGQAYGQTVSTGQNALGGIIRSPMISSLAERGPEAVIPLSGGRRAEGLLNYASKAIGMGGGGGGASVNFAPVITINGNATETEQRAMDSRLRDLASDFIAQFKRAQQQERRLSYESGYV